MYQKLFQITLVLFLVVVTVVMLGVVLSIVLSLWTPRLMAESNGIVAVSGGISTRQIGAMIVAGSLIIAGFFLFIRRSRFHR